MIKQKNNKVKSKGLNNDKIWFDETDFKSNDPMNIFNIAKKERPKKLVKPIFWDKEKHNYKVRFYNVTKEIYKHLWTGKYNLRDIKIEVKNDKMFVKLHTTFIDYIERVEPNALK